MHGRAITVAGEDIGAWACDGHIGEVFAPHDQRRIPAGARDLDRGCAGILGVFVVIGHHRVAAAIGNFGLSAKDSGGLRSNLFETLFGEITHGLIERADGAAQFDCRGQHIIGLRRAFNRTGGHHDLRHRIDIARGDGLQRGDNVGGGDDGINGLMGFGGMASFAHDLDPPFIRGGEKAARADREGAHGLARPIMHAVDLVDGEPLHQPLFDHHTAAAAAFFGGLKNDHGRAVEIARLAEVFRRAQQHGCVPVMATGMHHPVVCGRIGRPGIFEDRQRVHIGAQADGAA